MQKTILIKVFSDFNFITRLFFCFVLKLAHGDYSSVCVCFFGLMEHQDVVILVLWNIRMLVTVADYYQTCWLESAIIYTLVSYLVSSSLSIDSFIY